MDLEVAAEKMVSDAGAKPAFKGYYVPAAGATYRFVPSAVANAVMSWLQTEFEIIWESVGNYESCGEVMS